MFHITFRIKDQFKVFLLIYLSKAIVGIREKQ